MLLIMTWLTLIRDALKSPWKRVLLACLSIVYLRVLKTKYKIRNLSDFIDFLKVEWQVRYLQFQYLGKVGNLKQPLKWLETQNEVASLLELERFRRRELLLNRREQLDDKQVNCPLFTYIHTLHIHTYIHTAPQNSFPMYIH